MEKMSLIVGKQAVECAVIRVAGRAKQQYASLTAGLK